MSEREGPSGERPAWGGNLWRMAPARVHLRDVTLRDGLQSESIVLSLEDKVSLARVIIDSGIQELEVTAFVHPGKVPAMSDAEQLWKALPRRPGIVYSALVFNAKGLDRALETGAEQIAVFVSASEAHSRRNAGKGIAEALREAREVLGLAAKACVATRSGVMSAFGCRLEGGIPADRVVELVRALHEMGPGEMTLADTSGTGDPRQIADRVASCQALLGGTRLSLHLHDAAGWGLANLATAVQLGVDTFDVTLGGLGGCPFLPGAPGNLSVHQAGRFLEAMGIDTEVDLDNLLQGLPALEKMVGRPLYRPL